MSKIAAEWSIRRPRFMYLQQPQKCPAGNGAHDRAHQQARAHECCEPDSRRASVRNQSGKFSVTDGPFSESKEVIGGYALLEASSREEAEALTRRFLEIHGDEYDITCEVRPLDGEEFGG